MAREVRFRIARAYSQLFPRADGLVAPAQHARRGIAFDWLEGEELSPEGAYLHREVETRQRLASRDVAQLEGEPLQW